MYLVVMEQIYSLENGSGGIVRDGDFMSKCVSKVLSFLWKFTLAL